MKKVTVKESTVHGKGVFAAESISSGERIIEYVGERISATEGDKRAEEGNVYIFNVSKTLDIDGAKEGNGAQFVNHSCDGNAKWVIEGDRVFIDAISNIVPGEEILYDYELESDELDPCYCGSDNCRKYMNNPKDIVKLKSKD